MRFARTRSPAPAPETARCRAWPKLWPDAVEKRARRAVLRGEFARRIQRASAQRDFKHAEQIQRDERDERDEADDEDRAAELHSPAGVMPGGLDADDNGRERKK